MGFRGKEAFYLLSIDAHRTLLPDELLSQRLLIEPLSNRFSYLVANGGSICEIANLGGKSWKKHERHFRAETDVDLVLDLGEADL